MGDFHQNGNIATLHNLTDRPVQELEKDLIEFSRHRPMGLVIPSLYSELATPALENIVHELSRVPYLNEIVIGLDQADEAEYRHALEFFGRLPQHFRVLWNDGPRLRAIDAKLAEKGLAPSEPGKGRNVWYCYGYTAASGRASTVALHDADIKTYKRDLLARLIYPVANPGFSFDFSKGYYARSNGNTLGGRVTRLLVTPLILALRVVCGRSDYLDFLHSFRYPLAGEFALRRNVIDDLRIPTDWGLEIGVLSEMFRNHSPNRLCQVDIADTYDHKHQDLSVEDQTRGLSRMSIDIAKAMYRKLAIQGETFSTDKVRTIKATYFRIALDLVELFEADAAINGLAFNRHAEEEAVALFAANIVKAGDVFRENPMDTPFIPPWNSVISAVPNVLEELRDAVEQDMEEFGALTAAVQGAGAQRLEARVLAHLELIYGDKAGGLVERVVKAMRYPDEVTEPAPYQNYWDESDCWMISYARSIQEHEQPGLSTLQDFCDRYLGDSINGLHILPFYPFSSDDGFAVIDYYSVDEDAGSWNDIQSLAQRYRLMADLVINHASSHSAWFQNFISRKDPGKDYFKESSPEEDLSLVVRPRSTPLRTEIETADGKRWVWCTFGPDQVDLDFGNPEVLLEFVKIVRFYLENGVRVLRLDAVAFLWKEPGTTSLHDQRTHEIVKLFRTLIDFYDPSVMLITETNVPNRDNLTYFGNSNEAHAIYNFSLPPLLIHTLLTGDCRHLKTWMMSMPPARSGTTYFNFIASHDGIGMRPVDGLLSEAERTALLETLTSFGGRISLRTGPDGAAHPYEVNISLIDALAGTEAGPDEYQLDRYICAHAIMLALEGIPGLYIHSLLGTSNDYEGLARTGQYRSINRHAWDKDRIAGLLEDPESVQSIVLRRMRHLLQLRRGQQAFHPNAVQFTLQLGLQTFGIWRQSTDRRQDVFSISNISREHQSLELANINLVSSDSWWDLISGQRVEEGQVALDLAPYQTVWLTNK